MIRSDTTAAAQASGSYTVRQAGERWLVVRQVPGADYASVVADCLTERAARGVADEFNSARQRYEVKR
jgi:hypothetical protein